MSLQQFLELADCRVGLTQWSRQTVPESGSSDLEGSITKACVSARDHTGWNIRRTKPTATDIANLSKIKIDWLIDIWDKLAVIRQVARYWTIQRLVCEHSELKLNTSSKWTGTKECWLFNKVALLVPNLPSSRFLLFYTYQHRAVWIK